MSIILKISFLACLLVSCSQVQIPSYIKGDRPEQVDFFPTWSKNLDPVYNSGNLPVGLQSPVIKSGILYIGSNDGRMNAFDMDNGREVWSKEDNGSYHGDPIIVGKNLVYGTVEGRLYARDLLNGKLIYNVDLGAAVEGKPYEHRGRLFVHTRNHKVFSLDVKTGKILWGYKRSVPYLTTLQRVSNPVVFNNRLYVGFADGSLGCFNINEGILIWESRIVNGKRFVDVDSSPVYFNGHLVLGSLQGPLTAVNARNGLISRTLPYNVGRTASVVDGNLMVGTTNGKIVILDKFFKVVKEKQLSEHAISSFTPWKKGWAVGSVGGEVFYLEKDTFNLISKISLGHSHSAIFGNLTTSDNKLAVFSSRNRLYIYK